ncbi:MAG: acetyltransferase [Flavobacteriaceae bacterium]|nr:acetyltransferase [Flavobacteriaceae bacterium]
MKKEVVLYGASGHCKVVIEALQLQEVVINKVLDDHPKQQEILNIPIQKPSVLNGKLLKNIIITIGNNKTRKKISADLNAGYARALHPKAIISRYCSIGDGSVVLAGAVINADTAVGNHCIINTLAVIEHDCKIADFVHISPKVSLAGNVTIGEGAHIGIGAFVIPGITIGKWSTIGAGAVILKDVPDYAVVVGNPGKVIKYNLKDE